MQSSVNILGVEFDNKLTFTNHVREIAKKCARKLGCVRRISYLLDSRGCSMLYNSQIRSLMEYSPLVWSSCPPSYLRLLDKVQDRARRLVEFKKLEGELPIFFQSLQHRRDVAGLCVLYKVQRLSNPHLSALRLRSAPQTGYNTRASHSVPHELEVPFSRTEQYMRSFHPRFSRLWNKVVQHLNMEEVRSPQQFKSAVHQWRLLNVN